MDSQPKVRSTTHRFLTPVVQFLHPQFGICGQYEGGNGPMTGGIVIPFVQAQVLPPSGLQCSPSGLKVSYRWLQPPPRSGARLLRRPGGSFAPVGGVGSNRAPPKRALPMEQSRSTPPSSSHPPGQPRCPPALHTPPNAGRSDGWCYRLPTPWANGSTGNCFASER